ncbi:hypothetical protein Airi01_074420 [Actinoallomurus iriomotensis]|uniref:Uncharacterized protein n=1 Tax=Actinoallomurus iriomotensis TaxID=478107 RepID=A0A9W6VSY6_9ACTN|nr:hypothetical protein Airi01_074420 [Actinoallomurus iriomotensis]
MRPRGGTEGCSLTVPMRAETNGIIGDALIAIGPDRPDYEEWDFWISKHEEDDE